ncbi:hypothetical protein [Ferroplasma sp.]|uniref:hypothetical protein n=1 Tax=Ferroplasma sp. TaxID=2591003 RepID=UPI0026040090|nr:hypothetical protein [Ferroplasma sp.]
MMQATLEDFRPKRKIFQEFDYLIQEYIKAYGTDNYDKYDLYDFTWVIRGNLKIKNMPRNAFFSIYRRYLKAKSTNKSVYTLNRCTNNS